MGVSWCGGGGSETVVVDSRFRAEVAYPHGQFDGSPAVVVGFEVHLRRWAGESLLLACKEERRLHLPGAKGDVPANGALLQAFFGEPIFRQHAKRPQVVVRLRRQSGAMAGFRYARREGEETDLAERLEGRKRLTIHIAGGEIGRASCRERV